MIKRFLTIALACLVSAIGARATTVSGNLKDIGANNVTGGNTYVQFTLEGYGVNIARVTGSNVIATTYVNLYPDSSGNISGSIQGNDTISVGANAAGGTWYRVCIYSEGQQFRCAAYTIAGSSWNLTTAAPNTTAPTVPSPTGDSTYLRLDSGNGPVTGPPTINGQLAASGDFNNVITPQQYGAKCDGVTDDSVALQNAINAVYAIGATSGASLYVRPGSSCLYSTQLQIEGVNAAPSVPTLLITGSKSKQSDGNAGSGFIYTGSGAALLIQNSGGPSNPLTVNITIQNLMWRATGAATSMILGHQILGPLVITGNTFTSPNSAANAITCDTGCGIQVNITNNLIDGFLGKGIALYGGGNYNVQDNQTFSVPVCYYFSSAVVLATGNYCELATDAFEIANDGSEGWGDYDIHGNHANVGYTPPPPGTATSAQRCLLVKSTNDSYPFYVQGNFSDNFCNESQNFSPGAGTYAADFSTSTNVFGVSQTWRMQNNTFLGMLTSAIVNDSTNVSVALSGNVSLSQYSVSSPASRITLTSGVGTYLPFVQSAGTLKQHYIPKINAAGQAVNSSLQDDGTTISSAEHFKMSGLQQTGTIYGAICQDSSGNLILNVGAPCYSRAIPASLTTTATTSDNVTVTGMTSSGHCTATATNSTASALTGVYVSGYTTNQVTLYHSATAGGTFNLLCTPN